MKKPFRFMRGELLAGHYLKNFLTSRNDAVLVLLDELVYHANVRWKLESEISSGELPMRDTDMVGIGKFAGIFKPIQYGETTAGSIYLTESNIVNGAERSERGLYKTATGTIEFVRTENDDYATDISEEASSTKRMALVPSGTTPIGYVKIGTQLYESDGTIIQSAILSAPPADGSPYITYYGEKYLTFQETFNSQQVMTIEMFKEYFECLMRISYNGVSIYEFLYLTDLLCSDYVYDIAITQVDYHYTVEYSLNLNSATENKIGRFSTWKYIVEQKFKLFVLTERLI